MWGLALWMTLSQESHIFSRLLNPATSTPPPSIYLIPSEKLSGPHFNMVRENLVGGRTWQSLFFYAVSYPRRYWPCSLLNNVAIIEFLLFVFSAFGVLVGLYGEQTELFKGKCGSLAPRRCWRIHCEQRRTDTGGKTTFSTRIFVIPLYVHIILYFFQHMTHSAGVMNVSQRWCLVCLVMVKS